MLRAYSRWALKTLCDVRDVTWVGHALCRCPLNSLQGPVPFAVKILLWILFIWTCSGSTPGLGSCLVLGSFGLLPLALAQAHTWQRVSWHCGFVWALSGLSEAVDRMPSRVLACSVGVASDVAAFTGPLWPLQALVAFGGCFCPAAPAPLAARPMLGLQSPYLGVMGLFAGGATGVSAPAPCPDGPHLPLLLYGMVCLWGQGTGSKGGAEHQRVALPPSSAFLCPLCAQTSVHLCSGIALCCCVSS